MTTTLRNFGLFSLGTLWSRCPKYHRPCWDWKLDDQYPRGYCCLNATPPLHWPIRLIARLFGGWSPPTNF